MHKSEGGGEEARVASAEDARAGGPAAFLTRRSLALRLLAGAPAVFYLVMVLLPPLNHDVAAVFDFAQRWIDGGRLYVDLVDVNPPLVFILNLLPAAIAHYTPIPGPQALLLCLLLHAGLLWRACVALRRDRPEGPVEAATLAAAIPLLLLVAGSDFGQREVIMAISAIPYALLAERRIAGAAVPPRLALGVAAAAAIAFALKPHFLVVPLFIEAFILLRRGLAPALKDPVPALMAAIWIGYLAVILLLFPAYLRDVVPMAWGIYGSIHGAGLWSVLVTDLMGAAIPLLVLGIALALHRAAGDFARALALAALGAFVSAWIQHKGWTYHVLPVTILSLAALAAAAARWADTALPEADAGHAAPGMAAVAALAIMCIAVRGSETPWRQFWFAQEQAGRMTEWLRREAFGGRILVLSPEILPVYPSITYANARPTLRTMSTWPLQGAYRTCPAGPAPYHAPAEMGRLEALLWNSVAEEFFRSPPRAVLVTRFSHIPACGGRFDLLEYFARHPLFARGMQRFRPAGEMDGYRLFVRRL